MKLADKPCYPVFNSDGIPTAESNLELDLSGLTFRERLIVALASNSAYVNQFPVGDEEATNNAKYIICQADAIIKELEKAK